MFKAVSSQSLVKVRVTRGIVIKVGFLIPACSQQKQVIPMTTLEETQILTWRGRMFQKTLPGVQDLRGTPTTGRGMRRRLPPTAASARGARYHSNRSQSARPAWLPLLPPETQGRRVARSSARRPLAAEGETADVWSASRLARPVTKGLVHSGGLQ